MDVQWSTEELFKPVNTKTRRNQVSPLVLDVPGRLVDAQVFVRVSEPGAESWSVPTKAWVTTETCLDTQYLEDTSPDPPELAMPRLPRGRLLCGIRRLVRCGGQVWILARARTRSAAVPSLSAALGVSRAPNPDLYNRYYDGEREETKDLARFHWWNASGQPEACHEAWGFKERCGDSTCRLCSTCRTGFKRKGLADCTVCPEEGANRALLALGILAVLFGAGFIVYLSIQKGGGCGGGERGRQEDPVELSSSRQHCRPLPHAVARSRSVFL